MSGESIDDIAAKFGSMIDGAEDFDDAEEVEIEEEEVEAVESEAAVEDVDEEEKEAEMPGFMSYEDWVADGKDPELYKGRKAYKAEYERIQEVKSYKKEVKLMNETLNSTVEAIAAREAKLIARHKEELEAALDQAKEDGDTEAALKAQGQLRDLDSEPTLVASSEPRVNPVISEFIGSNVVLNDDEVSDEFARIYNGKLKADGVSPDEQLKDTAIKGYLNDAMRSLKNLYPDKFASSKLSRKAPPRQKAAPVKAVGNYGEKLRGMEIDDSSLQKQDPAYSIYKMLKKSQGDDVAENYAKKVLRVKQ